MFPFGIFPFNILPTANPWWPIQAVQAQEDLKKLQNSMPPFMRAYVDAYNAWLSMMAKGAPWMNTPDQKDGK